MHHDTSTFHRPDPWTRIRSMAETGAHQIGGLFSRFWAASATLVKEMQFARMMRVLHDMSDEQLENIELKRTDIRAHAAMLVGLERS
ncbi:MAG: hypothetical protein WBB25_17745 [Sulfitobacter sp.]